MGPRWPPFAHRFLMPAEYSESSPGSDLPGAGATESLRRRVQRFIAPRACRPASKGNYWSRKPRQRAVIGASR